MKNKTKSNKITVDIIDLFKGKEIPDPEEEHDSLSKVVEFDDYDNGDDNKLSKCLSEFRKKNITLLNEIDKKYRGIFVSRYELNDKSESVSDETGEFNDDEEEESVNLNDFDEGCSVTNIEDYDIRKISKSDVESNDAEQSDEENEDCKSFSYIIANDSRNNQSTMENKLITKINTAMSDNINKGIAVKNQLKAWENLLEMRIHLQKMLISSNSIPSKKLFDSLSIDKDFINGVCNARQSLNDLIDNFLELQSGMLSSYNEFKFLNITKGDGKRKLETDFQSTDNNKRLCSKYSKLLEDNFSNYIPYAYTVIKKWDDRTKLFSKSEKNLNSHNDYGVVRRIESVLSNKIDLIRKCRIVKADYKIVNSELDSSIKYINKIKANFEQLSADDNSDNEKKKKDIEMEIYSTEVYDDTDFYHQLLRELIEHKTSSLKNPTEILKQYTDLEKLRKKMKKKVDMRASKGRKIRYVIHKKLVNFMAPNPESKWTDQSKDELFNSLFGRIKSISN